MASTVRCCREILRIGLAFSRLLREDWTFASVRARGISDWLFFASSLSLSLFFKARWIRALSRSERLVLTEFLLFVLSRAFASHSHTDRALLFSYTSCSYLLPAFLPRYVLASRRSWISRRNVWIYARFFCFFVSLFFFCVCPSVFLEGKDG